MSDDAKRQKIDAMYEKVRRNFAGVDEITPEQLPALQQREHVVLVDVRTPEEQAVSMIPGAITAEQLEQHSAEHQGATLVPYCTIGGRSGQYAEAMKARGWKVYNLKGAILAWTHAGGDLVGPDGPTRRVHTHGRKFDLVAEGFEAVW